MSVLVVDKPPGPTSFDVVNRIRRALRQHGGASRKFKIGHGGTLDPLATGVLPVCLGEATKLAPFLLDADKEYEATARFGIETDTLDAQGAVLAEVSVAGLTEAAVERALPQFVGDIEQVPPMYSALKRDGRPLYEYARAGIEVERAPRRITVFAIEPLGWEPPATFRMRVRCSKGTYVRSLVADLGMALGVGAHLSALRRTASGPFRIGQAIGLADAETLIAAGGPLPLVSLADALGHLAVAKVGPEVAREVAQGKRVAAAAIEASVELGDRPFRLLRSDGGSLLAVAVLENALLRTLRVFNETGQGDEVTFPGRIG